MLATFASGIAFAIGHHFFYQSLDGTPVNSTTFDQQINIGIGTAFAFLVRALLVVAVGVAFVQVLWRSLLNERIAVSRIDSMSQLLTSLFALCNFKTLWQYPVLAVLATISWTLPIAMIIPPATLSVHTLATPHLQQSALNLPLLDFAKPNFTKLYVSNGPDILSPQGAPNQIEKQYFGGSLDSLSQLALGTAIQGEIQSIQPPATNSSYTLHFFGPSLRCQAISAAIIRDFDTVFGCNFTDINGNNSCGFAYTYLAWVPDFDSRVPVGASNGVLNFVPEYDGSGYGLTTTGGYGSEPATVYVGTTQDSETWSVLNCSLYNASYTVGFEFQNGNQTLSSSAQLHNGLPFVNLAQTTMLANLTGEPPAGTVTPNANVNAVSYQAVMDSFGQIMVGGIYHAVDIDGGGTNVDATHIMSTNLQNCAELSSSGGDNSSTSTLARVAEQLFENITLSLFSQSAYMSGQNSSSFSVAPTDVTISTFPNTYVYTWKRLVLAYGLAVLFAAIAVVIGGLALLASGESYSYTFSTLLRTTRHKAVDAVVKPDDTNGQDPLPKHIAEARIMVGGNLQGDASDDHEDDVAMHQQGQPVARHDSQRQVQQVSQVQQAQPLLDERDNENHDDREDSLAALQQGRRASARSHEGRSPPSSPVSAMSEQSPRPPYGTR
jgi:hypothetical protein